MKIRYSFVNETISIDVPDDWGEILIDLDRQEYNNDHKETRRHYSLEGKVYEGMDYAAEDSAIITRAVSTVKSSPSDSTAKDLFVLHEGTKVTVIDELGSWLNIELSDGRQGWISSSVMP